MSAPSSPEGLSLEQLAEIRAIADRAAAREFLFSDCEGVLKVWALSALKHVARDGDGAITGWSEPGAYLSADLVAEVELDMATWDPGEDMDDDQRRQDVGDMVRARAVLGALLAEAERLQKHFDKALAAFNAQSLRVTELEEQLAAAEARAARSGEPR